MELSARRYKENYRLVILQTSHQETLFFCIGILAIHLAAAGACYLSITSNTCGAAGAGYPSMASNTVGSAGACYTSITSNTFGVAWARYQSITSNTFGVAGACYPSITSNTFGAAGACYPSITSNTFGAAGTCYPSITSNIFGHGWCKKTFKFNWHFRGYRQDSVLLFKKTSLPKLSLLTSLWTLRWNSFINV